MFQNELTYTWKASPQRVMTPKENFQKIRKYTQEKDHLTKFPILDESYEYECYSQIRETTLAN